LNSELAALYRYLSSNGELLGYMCCIQLPDGREQFEPVTYCQQFDGKLGWCKVGFDEPQPLYGLDRLSKKPDAPVLIVADEKVADAAGGLFPSYAVITWPNGAYSLDLVDWSPLRNRRVVISPDDDTGRRAAEEVAAHAMATGAAAVRVVFQPRELPDG
jgi:hypothetical protein